MRKERKTIDQALCDHVRILLAGGATLEQAAMITDVGHATISRIKRAGFDAEVYRQHVQQRRTEQKPEPQPAEEQVPGQIAMDLTEAKPEMSEQTKLMRFQAAQVNNMIIQQAKWVDDLCMKIERLNDSVNMILRKLR